uniref:Uncharacterized protein n=1 Tax=Anguilla anguilla TaxID=7936 RepID=A0A0E9UA58_ANGAN
MCRPIQLNLGQPGIQIEASLSFFMYAINPFKQGDCQNLQILRRFNDLYLQWKEAGSATQ